MPRGIGGCREWAGYAGTGARSYPGKGLDNADAVLRKAIAYRIVQAMRMQEMSGRIAAAAKRKGVKLWVRYSPIRD